MVCQGMYRSRVYKRFINETHVSNDLWFRTAFNWKPLNNAQQICLSLFASILYSWINISLMEFLFILCSDSLDPILHFMLGMITDKKQI